MGVFKRIPLTQEFIYDKLRQTNMSIEKRVKAFAGIAVLTALGLVANGCAGETTKAQDSSSQAQGESSSKSKRI